ncbi:hypothetical protein QBC36DRAFT_322498 [Triangularia setosa]|uniref:Secreted protein n=1 Tax=Triangularia setosa TaxID=2587417 RepID=A0AAN7A9V4_9PEZI|nr:hypothetical protein QBC36DRAFT_322498 [Podospora setosa]
MAQVNIDMIITAYALWLHWGMAGSQCPKNQPQTDTLNRCQHGLRFRFQNYLRGYLNGFLCCEGLLPFSTYKISFKANTMDKGIETTLASGRC